MRSILYLETMFDDLDGEPYKVLGPFKIYIQRDIRGRYRYLPRVDAQYISLLPYMREIYLRHPTKEDLIEVGEDYSFSKLHQVLRNRISMELSGINGLTLLDTDVDRLSELLFWEIVGLTRLAPLMMDDEVEEVFIDGFKSPAYLNHRRFGRCETDVIVRREEVDALITHIELHKGISINYSRGNLESELETGNMRMRINIDLEPLASAGPYIIMRNLRRKPYTLVDLIRMGTLSAEAAAFILSVAWTRLNITIAGEVNTGKTTLLNAIDMALPSRYRKIYIEEALESVDMRDRGRYQAFYRADAYSKNLSKRRQITFTLHRTPDILVFGEVLTDDDVRTFFYSLSCGLKGLQTIHARSIDSLLRRWILHHRVSPEALRDLDIIVFMKRSLRGERYVEGVYEVVEDGRVRAVFRRGSEGLEKVMDICDTDVYRKIVEELGGREEFNRLYNGLAKCIRDSLARNSFSQMLEELEKELFGEGVIDVRASLY